MRRLLIFALLSLLSSSASHLINPSHSTHRSININQRSELSPHPSPSSSSLAFIGSIRAGEIKGSTKSKSKPKKKKKKRKPSSLLKTSSTPPSSLKAAGDVIAKHVTLERLIALRIKIITFIQSVVNRIQTVITNLRSSSGGSAKNVRNAKLKKPVRSTKGANLKKKTSPSTSSSSLSSSSSISSPSTHRLSLEVKKFLTSPPKNLSLKLHQNNLRSWLVTITGGLNTVYANEVYHLRLVFPPRYPSKPPSVYFLKSGPNGIPKHEHVYSNGDICLSLLGSDWSPSLTGESICLCVQSMLSSAKRKGVPLDNGRMGEIGAGGSQEGWVYHDDNC